MPSANAFELDDIEDIVGRDTVSLQRGTLKNSVLPHPRLTTFEKKSKSTELKEPCNESEHYGIDSRYCMTLCNCT